MKQLTQHLGKMVLIGLLFSTLSGLDILAQGFDYLDVAEGYETLNLAIEEDTTAGGEPQSLNRVYRLARGGMYLINGSISNVKGAPLRIFAAEGAGPKPLVIMAVDETGAAEDFGVLEGDSYLKNLYLSGSNMLGNDNRYCILIYANDARIVMDGLNVDFADQAHVKTYSKNNKIYWLNCEMRNGYLLTDNGRGRFFDARGLMPDSLVIINSTFYVNKQRILRMDKAMIANIVIDHSTFYLNAYGGTTSSGAQIDGPIETGRGINVRITNSIFQDLGVEAIIHPSSVDPYDRMPIVHVDTVYSADYPEASRNWVVRNNAYGWSPEVKAFWATIDTVKGPAFISPWGMDHYFGGHKPNFVAENNFEEYIQFTDAPSPDALLDFVKYRFATNFSNIGNPDFRADRNGIGSLQEHPETFGAETDPYNFDYPTDQIAYTAGDDGLPLGDLNWFPEKKAAWEAIQQSGIGDRNDGVVSNYVLEQNYPNPFNPGTQIHYYLPRTSRVTVSVYNAVGQLVETLMDKKEHAAGNHSLTWNAKGISSGIYYYCLETDDLQITKKMVLIK